MVGDVSIETIEDFDELLDEAIEEAKSSGIAVGRIGGSLAGHLTNLVEESYDTETECPYCGKTFVYKGGDMQVDCMQCGTTISVGI